MMMLLLYPRGGHFVRAASAAVSLIEALVQYNLYSFYKDDVTTYGVACHFHTYNTFLTRTEHTCGQTSGRHDNLPLGVKIVSFK